VDGVFVGSGEGGDDFIEGELDGGGGFGVDVEGDGLVVGVAGLAVPVLAFALVGWEPEVAAIGEVELLVDVEDGLELVVAGGEGVEVGDGVADGFGVDDDGLAGSEAFDVDSEALCGLVVFAELEAGLVGAGAAGGFFRFFFGFGDDEDEVSVERGFGGDGDLDAKLGGGGEGGEEECGEGEGAAHVGLGPLGDRSGI
jgi:hypothetical protein